MDDEGFLWEDRSPPPLVVLMLEDDDTREFLLTFDRKSKSDKWSMIMLVAEVDSGSMDFWVWVILMELAPLSLGILDKCIWLFLLCNTPKGFWWRSEEAELKVEAREMKPHSSCERAPSSTGLQVPRGEDVFNESCLRFLRFKDLTCMILESSKPSSEGLGVSSRLRVRNSDTRSSSDGGTGGNSFSRSDDCDRLAFFCLKTEAESMAG